MAEELVRTRCSDGWLVVTDTAIRIERKGFLGGAGSKQTVLPRQALIGADATNKFGSVFGQGGATTLTFSGYGMTIVAKMVNPKDARKIMEALGFA